MEAYRKVFVEVIAKFTTEGKIIPITIKWEDDTMFDIDRVNGVMNRAAMKVGGIGVRYDCMIKGKQAYIFLEDNKWYVEAKV